MKVREPTKAAAASRTRDAVATRKEGDVMGCVCCVSVAIATTPMPVKVDTTNHLVRRDRVAQIATQSRREDIPIVTRASHDNPAG